MERIPLTHKLGEFMKKHRYALAVVLLGVVLMLLPSVNSKEESAVPVQIKPQTYEGVEQQMKQILSHIKGAGRVEVMLTVASGEATVYEKDTNVSNVDTGSSRLETVIVTDANRNQSALIQRVDPPVYLGAIIVCDGADSAAVRYSITEAVAKITGLGTDKISVFKMK